MQGTWTKTLAVVFALGLVSPMALYAEEKEGKEGKEEKVSAEQLPQAVRAAIEKEGGKLGEIEKEDEDGKVVYEADLEKDGKEFELKVAEDGTVLSREAEAEDEDEDEKDEKEVKVSAEQLPPAVKAALEKEGAKLDDVEKEEEGGKVVYEADAEKDGKELEIKVAEDGTVISREAEDEEEEDEDEKEGSEEKVSMDQLPSAVRETIVKQAEGGQVTEVEKEVKDGKTVYEAEVKKDGQEFEIKVDEQGKFLGKEAEKEDGEKEEHEGQAQPDRV